MNPDEITYKSMTKSQLSNLKEIYIESFVNHMSEQELRKFAKEILDLQVNGTVGYEEEKEVWKEMKNHFKEEFDSKLKIVIENTKSKQEEIDPSQEEFLSRLEILEQRKKEENNKQEDMW